MDQNGHEVNDPCHPKNVLKDRDFRSKDQSLEEKVSKIIFSKKKIKISFKIEIFFSVFVTNEKLF